jgi:hypothetical protein
MKNFDVTLLANWYRAIDLLPQIYSKAPPSNQNYFLFDFEGATIAYNG